MSIRIDMKNKNIILTIYFFSKEPTIAFYFGVRFDFFQQCFIVCVQVLNFSVKSISRNFHLYCKSVNGIFKFALQLFIPDG